MTRPIGSAAELERRRRRAVALVEQGESPSTVARIIGVHETSVHRWRRMARQEGGLDPRPHPGPRPGLSEGQLAQLERLLLQGAKAHGWRNQLWTAGRVAALIKRHFQLDYHPEHVRKILKRRLNWTSQKPRRKARERDDKEVSRWAGDEFPRIVREAFARRAYLVFLDESGFSLTPTVRRSLAPRGQTPVLEAWDRRDKISAISCISLSPVLGRANLHFELLPDNANATAEDVVAFLEGLYERLGAMTVVWDRSNIHSKARLVRAWLFDRPDIVVEDFPGYVPDLNPDEGVWGWAKYGRLSNLAADDTDWLRDFVWEELDGLKHRTPLLRAFIRQTRLPGLLRAA